MEMLESKLGKIVFARLSTGEDLLETINLVAEKSHVSAGFFVLIGTLRKTNLGYYREGKHETIVVDQPVEIVSCTGNISLKDDKPFAHAHVSVSNEKGEVMGGHVMPGCEIGVIGQLVLVEAADARLVVKFDEKTHLSLWSIKK